jgi:hypothetical protein
MQTELQGLCISISTEGPSVMSMTNNRRFCVSNANLTALVFCSVLLSIHKFVFAQVPSAYCSTKDEVWFKGYFEAQMDYKKGPMTLRYVW